MLSSVLRSARAVQVNIEIMRAFVRLRQLLQSNADLAKKLEALEKKYDSQFRVVFDAIRELMAPQTTPKTPIGFRAPRTRRNASAYDSQGAIGEVPRSSNCVGTVVRLRTSMTRSCRLPVATETFSCAPLPID